jgi:hypothetical protein
VNQLCQLTSCFATNKQLLNTCCDCLVRYIETQCLRCSVNANTACMFKDQITIRGTMALCTTKLQKYRCHTKMVVIELSGRIHKQCFQRCICKCKHSALIAVTNSAVHSGTTSFDIRDIQCVRTPKSYQSYVFICTDSISGDWWQVCECGNGFGSVHQVEWAQWHPLTFGSHCISAPECLHTLGLNVVLLAGSMLVAMQVPCLQCKCHVVMQILS